MNRYKEGNILCIQFLKYQCMIQGITIYVVISIRQYYATRVVHENASFINLCTCNRPERHR
jgi:hypothetical protein